MVLKELTKFFGKAASATYAGSGKKVDPQRPGFIELKYEDGPWSYRDSYCGFFQSWGRGYLA